MDPSLDEQILDAIELFHYSYKFRESVFAIVVHSSDALRLVLPDLKVLQSSRIGTCILARSDPRLERQLKRWNLRGYDFDYRKISLKDPAQDTLPLDIINKEMDQGSIPVLAFEDLEKVGFAPCRFYDSALMAASRIRARKVFFPGPYTGLEVDGEFLSHPSYSEVQSILDKNQKLNMDPLFLRYLTDKQKELGMDLIVLSAQSGSLFQEIFSHRGSGTLFSSEYRSVFRQALPADVSDIALVMKPYIKAGAILPVTESQIFDTLKDYYVYTVNGQVVASAKLTDYGASCEIGKICTLPRYQRKGRARAITERVIELARSKKKTSVFSLSTQERMFVFFRQLGFTEVPREELPEDWKKGYDFARPSRAFRLAL